LWIRFLSGPDIDALGLANADIIAAVDAAVRAHGEGRVVFEPRVHLVPDNDGAGHFNILRGHLPAAGPGGVRGHPPAAGVSGIKVVGDFVDNYARGLPSELGLLTLYDPATGIPLSIMDATMITACRTGAMTAAGARYLARPDSRILGHVGARGTAFWNVVLLDEMFDLQEIRITSRRPQSREAFALELAAVTDTPVRVTATADETFAGADILVEASRLTEPAPLLRTSVVKPGAFVVPYGHGQRRRARPARRDGQGRGRRLAGGAVGALRRAAAPC
jgi:ornithine cyclodeaminase